jgi:2OG-Fe(II) oxygenase superfamily
MIVDLDAFEALVERERSRFAGISPFPYVVVDDLLDASALRAVAAEFGDAGDAWTYWHHINERKRGLSDRGRMGPAALAVIEALETPEFLRLLGRLTGVERLLADPHLDGGGLHESEPGGFLNVHTDFLAHTRERTWAREVNLLVFLNEGWRPEDGGCLELWDAQVARCERRIEPRFNRAVLFRTSRVSFHGVTPITCSPGASRKSIALYYFRDAGHPLGLTPTRYVPRPGDGALRRALIHADRFAVRVYSALKRYTPVGDAVISKILRRF